MLRLIRSAINISKANQLMFGADDQKHHDGVNILHNKIKVRGLEGSPHPHVTLKRIGWTRPPRLYKFWNPAFPLGTMEEIKKIKKR